MASVASTATTSVPATTALMQSASSVSRRVSSPLGSSSLALPQLRRRPGTLLVIRAAANNRQEGNVLDKTKVEITEEEVLKNQEQNESEKRPIFGSKPSETYSNFKGTSLYPRPEIERRPETGEKSFGSLMAFDGAGPETINGRLAMVGVLWAIFAEVTTGQSLQQQLFSPEGRGLFYFLAVVQLLAYASLVPMFKGESPDSRKFGPFQAKAERWNGRTAMIGFLSLVTVEIFRGGAPLFHM